MISRPTGRSSLVPFTSKPRVFILTDITNEPDDEESLCRYLTYANQFRTEGIVAVTSTWLRDRVAPERVISVIDAYAEVVDNLNAHAHLHDPYPSAEGLKSLVRAGPPAVGDDVLLSEGGQLLLERLTSTSDDPLWVIVWGGANVLAQVLHNIRNRPDAAKFRSKLRVYTISDQDDSGAWIRQQWPELFYICSVHGWNQYNSAAWTGISAPVDEGGPNAEVVSKEWVKEHIQIGPLGKAYPTPEFIIEGDTPTFLYLIQNGLGFPEEPSYGSWGGRYIPVNVSEKGLPNRGHFSDAADTVLGLDGKRYSNNKVTIWRWRKAFQHDHAARVQWTLTSDFSKANHKPVIAINGDVGLMPVEMDVDAGSSFTIDASDTYDPDGDELTFKWWQYREPSATQTFHGYEVSNLKIEEIEGTGGRKVKITVPPADKSCLLVRERISLEKGLLLHLILEVTDNGTPSLTSYRRILIQPINRDYRGPVQIGLGKMTDSEISALMKGEGSAVETT